MWTVINWDRGQNQWIHMRGFHDEEMAFERCKDWVGELLPNSIISLADPDGKIVWAAIGSHPVIGRCADIECWCYDHPEDEDHTLECAGHQIGKG